MSYSIVLLDGKERQNVSLEELKDLFFKRQINQNSLVCSIENPSWQMLKRAFDVSQWIPSTIPQTNSQSTFQTQNNPFAQTNPVNQPSTFNQFPPNQTAQSNNPYAPNASNGYSQNNQTETYYQAESSQSQYNFQNNQPNVEPSKYNNPANSHYNPKNPYNNASNFTNIEAGRNGARHAAVFLMVNAVFYVVFLIFESVFSKPGENHAEQVGQGVGRALIPLLIDLVLASKLWKQDNIESARKWVLVRTYFGFIVFGLVFPFLSLQTGNIFLGVFSFVSFFFYFISISIVLHGKENPSQSRVMIGIGTFAIYFLVMFGTIALGVVGKLAPNFSKLEIADKQYDKFKIEGKEFVDKTNGAKVVLPEGWSMLSLDNPLIHTPEARMIAIDKPGNRLTMHEVVPVPGNLDLKRQNSTVILDHLADGVVQSLKEEVKKSGGFTSKNTFNEVTRLNIYVGTHPAKLLVFDKTTDGLKAKGHLIITYDELTFYVLHSWCPAEEYDKAQAEFTFFEKNFSIPDKISSPFTQTAEKEKNKADTKKNF